MTFSTSTRTNNYLDITTPSNCDFMVVVFRPQSNTETTYSNIMLEYGTTSSPYQPYTSQTYPINLGSMELCKIGDYQDILFKNTMDSEYYDSSLVLNKWYLKKNVGKVVLDGEDTGIKVISSWDTTSLSGSYQASFSYLLTKATSTEYVILSNYFEKALLSDRNTKTNIIYTYSDGVLRIATNTSTTKADFLTWLSTHNTTVYYVLETPTYTLLNDTLQTQLDNLQYALAYDTQTNISQTNTDLPFIINAETYVDLTDYVKNTDYASSSKGGVIKTGYSSNIDANGSLYATNLSYTNYQNVGVNHFISKGTLESVITGKGLIDSSYHDSTKQDVIDNTLTTINKTIPTAINEVNSIAKGANQALSYGNYSTMITAFNSLANNVYNVGQNVMIITLQVPDLWISGIESTSQTYTYTTDEAFTTELNTNGYVQVGYYKLSALETQKVNLTNYVTFDDYATASTTGVVKTSAQYGISTSSYTKNLTGAVRTYAQYQSGNDVTIICKGTLENVITGKELDLKQLSTFDSTKTQVLKNINGTLTWVDE